MKFGATLWRSIFESVGIGLIVLSPEFELMAVNSAAEALTGSLAPHPERIESLLRDNPWLKAMLAGCIDSGQEVGAAREMLSARSRISPVTTHLTPLLDDAANLTGAIIVLTDLSHRQGMERSLGERGGENDVGLSPAGLAHEIKNPLTGVKGAAELLLGLLPENERVRQYCDLIFTGVTRIADLAEQVLSVSGPQRLLRRPANIHRILHQSLRTAGAFPAPPSGIGIEYQFDPSLPEIMGDEAALERVFLNLTRNALEAVHPSGRIRLRTRIETEFHLSANGKRRRFLRVEVSDSGKGLNDGEMARLFTPFFTTKPSGTGLGLVLSQQLVRSHGGEIWATRCEDMGGMTFRVTLPIAAEEP
ncbi:MAG: two-component system sensor histidine kinase NtrB [Candidatus Binataceae bacterium]